MSKRSQAVLLSALAGAILGASQLRAAPFVWDGGGSPDTNWSNGLNWTPDTGPTNSADTLSFTTAGAGFLANTVDAALASTTFTSLTYSQTDPTKTYVTTIASGVTLTLANPGSPSNTQSQASNSSLFIVPSSATSPSIANVQINGSGALDITDGNIVVSGKVASTTGNFSAAVLDLTGLASFTYDRSATAGAGILRVGGGETGLSGDGQYFGKIILGPLSNIAANRITIGGDNGGNTGFAMPVSTLVMGTLNNLNNGFAGSTAVAGGIYVGADPRFSKVGSGAIINAIGLTGDNAPVINIGTSAARNELQVGIGHVENNSGHSSFGVVDFTSASGLDDDPALRVSDGELHAFFSNLTLGKGPVKTETYAGTVAPLGGGVGMFSFDRGTVDATAILLGVASSAGNAVPNVGHLNVGLKGHSSDLGAGSLTAGTITLGQQVLNNVNTTNINQGVLNVANAGTVTADKIYVGNVTVGVAAKTIGVLNIGSGTTGGTVITSQVRQGGEGVPLAGTRIVNFNGGTLQVKAGTTGADATNFLTGMSSAVVWTNGGTIDTTGGDVTIAQPLIAPTGGGVESISFTGGTGYKVAPVVHITGGGGTGATAVAKINSDGSLNTIVVTNRGTGYTSEPTVYVLANGSIGSGTVATWANMQNPYGGTAAVANPVITQNTALTPGGITKTGNNTLTLTGASTYAGATFVNGGTLVVGDGVSGSLANSDVTVAANATLGGSGAVKSISLQANAHGTPGNSIGTQAVTALTLASDSNLDFEFGAPGTHAAPGSSDRYSVNAAASMTLPSSGALLNLIGDATSLGEGSYELISYTGTDPVSSFVPSTGSITNGIIATGSAGSIVLNGNWGANSNFTYNIVNDAASSGIFLDLSAPTSVPEPASLAMLTLGSVALLTRRRKD